MIALHRRCRPTLSLRRIITSALQHGTHLPYWKAVLVPQYLHFTGAVPQRRPPAGDPFTWILRRILPNFIQHASHLSYAKTAPALRFTWTTSSSQCLHFTAILPP